jgi:hypothetical protein
VNQKSFRGDVVVAADGIRSNARPFIIGEEPTPEVSGESAYRMLLRQEDLQAINHSLLKDGVIPPTIHLVTAPQRQIIIYPIRERTLLNIAAFVREPLVQTAVKYSAHVSTADTEMHEAVDDKWTSPGSIPSLVKSFDHFAQTWKDLLSSVSSCKLFNWSLTLTQDREGCWRLADARSVTTQGVGQGSCGTHRRLRPS